MNTNRENVKKYLQQIELLAKETQTKLENEKDITVILPLSNELVKNTNIFVFALGEICALEVSSPTLNKKISAKIVKSGINYHNLRDNSGRFIKKV